MNDLSKMKLSDWINVLKRIKIDIIIYKNI